MGNARPGVVSRARRVAVASVVCALVGLAGSVLGGCAAQQAESPTSRLSALPTAGSVDPQSGLPWVNRSQLPPEALDTLAEIAAGPPYPYDQDGTTFENREGILPQETTGYYQEFTVVTPGSSDRGARRIIAGAGGELYYTADHYASFARIAP